MNERSGSEPSFRSMKPSGPRAAHGEDSGIGTTVVDDGGDNEWEGEDASIIRSVRRSAKTRK